MQHAEGPCLDCHSTGEEVADVEIAASTERWPVFAPRAIELGFTTAHCFPLRLRDQVIGAMNVFRVQRRRSWPRTSAGSSGRWPTSPRSA